MTLWFLSLPYCSSQQRSSLERERFSWTVAVWVYLYKDRTMLWSEIFSHCDFCPLLCRWCICGWGSAVTRCSYVMCWATPIIHPYRPTWWVYVIGLPFVTCIFFHSVVLKVTYHISYGKQDFSCSFVKRHFLLRPFIETKLQKRCFQKSHCINVTNRHSDIWCAS